MRIAGPDLDVVTNERAAPSLGIASCTKVQHGEVPDVLEEIVAYGTDDRAQRRVTSQTRTGVGYGES